MTHAGYRGFLSNVAAVAEAVDADLSEYHTLVSTLAEHDMTGEYQVGELVDFCDLHGIYQNALGRSSGRGRSTRLGMLLGRYIGQLKAEGVDLARRMLRGRYLYSLIPNAS